MIKPTTPAALWGRQKRSTEPKPGVGPGPESDAKPDVACDSFCDTFRETVSGWSLLASCALGWSYASDVGASNC